MLGILETNINIFSKADESLTPSEGAKGIFKVLGKAIEAFSPARDQN